MKGVDLAARYAFSPNRRGYCGTNSFHRIMRSYIRKKAGLAVLRRHLRRFNAHYAYLSLIARENTCGPFDPAVVNSFWIGNGLLENVNHASLHDFIKNELFPKETPRAKKLAKNLPEGILPHHSFNALYINFLSNRVEKSVKNYDLCCVTPAEIISVSGKNALVKRWAIGWEHGYIMKPKIDCVCLEQDGIRLIGKVKKNDTVSVHWDLAVARLGPKDCSALKKYTQINIDAVNALLRR